MFELHGLPARVLIELDLGQDRRITFPIDSSLEMLSGRYGNVGELRIPLRGEWVNRTQGVLDDVAFRTGWDVN